MTQRDATARNLIAELRKHHGENIAVRTRTGEVTGTLLSVCVSGVWLICDGVDHIIGVDDVISHAAA